MTAHNQNDPSAQLGTCDSYHWESQRLPHSRQPNCVNWKPSDPAAQPSQPDELKRLQAVIERDRTKFSEVVTAIRHAVEHRDWLTEGRGPYEWNDDNWHKEFAAAGKEILGILEPLGKIAEDLSDSPKTHDEVLAARSAQPSDPLDLGFEVKREAGDVLIRDSDDIEWTSGVAWARSAPQTVVTMLADAYKVAVQTGHDLDYIAYTLDLAGNSDVSAICKAIKDMWGKLYVHETAQRESAAQPSQPECEKCEEWREMYDDDIRAIAKALDPTLGQDTGMISVTLLLVIIGKIKAEAALRHAPVSPAEEK